MRNKKAVPSDREQPFLFSHIVPFDRMIYCTRFGLISEPVSTTLHRLVRLKSGSDVWFIDQGRRENVKLGLVLSGDGVAASLVIGVLRALEEWKITPDYIVYSGAVSLPAYLYAKGASLENIETAVDSVASEAGNRSFLKKAFNAIAQKWGGIDSTERKIAAEIAAINQKVPVRGTIPAAQVCFEGFLGNNIICSSNIQSGGGGIAVMSAIPDPVLLRAAMTGFAVSPIRKYDQFSIGGTITGVSPMYWAVMALGSDKVIHVHCEQNQDACKAVSSKNHYESFGRNLLAKTEILAPKVPKNVLKIQITVETEEIHGRNAGTDKSFAKMMEYQNDIYNHLFFI